MSRPLSTYDTDYASLIVPSLIVGSAANYYGVKQIYNMLTPPPKEVSDSPAERVIWALGRILPPIVLVSWLSFEAKAFSYAVPLNRPYASGKLVNLQEKDGPLVVEIIDRIQANTFEQSFMTAMTSLSLAYWSDKMVGVDCRIAPAVSIMYCISRPIFIAGYMRALNMRFGGLFAGGFWSNFAAILYCLLLASGYKDTVNLRKKVIIGTPIGIFALLGVFIARINKN